jgi:hypothetical protein
MQHIPVRDARPGHPTFCKGIRKGLLEKEFAFLIAYQ